MADKKSPEQGGSKPAYGAQGVALRAVTGGQVELRHLPKPATIVRKPRIHARKLLPLVREGQERAFHSHTPATLVRALRRADAAVDDIGIAVNTELPGPAAQKVSANVNEPSTAINGSVAFYTGNWYASVSTDGGVTFKFIDPNSTAQPGETFCCDQVMQYIESIDTFVWLLQYGPNKDNFQRLAFAKTADVGTDVSKWRMFDITTAFLGTPGAFLDFPDLAVGNNFLYMTTNVFTADNQVRSAVVRIPLQSIAAGNPTAEKYLPMDLNLFAFRVAQNCRDTAYFAAHQDTSTLAVFSWPESAAQPTQSAVGIARYLDRNGFQSRTPDNRRWLDRADTRITGATLAGNELWFAWGVDRGSNQRTNPFIQIARINASDLTLLEDVNVFDTDSATCYAGLASNVNNEVAISYMIGGGTRFPSHMVGILTNNRKDVLVAAGDRAPVADPQSGNFEWGDYLTVRPAFPGKTLFAATGYVLKGPTDGNNVDATPHFVIFGRASDVAASGLGSSSSSSSDSSGGDSSSSSSGGDSSSSSSDGSGSSSSSSGSSSSSSSSSTGSSSSSSGVTTVGDGPITDVNLLSIVDGPTAAAIKAACMSAGQAPAMAMRPSPLVRFVTQPGSERWPVKTGQDADVALVGKNVIGGKNLGAGIVQATVEELVAIPRTPDTQSVTGLNPAYQSNRILPLEIVIWQIDVTINAIKMEADGDYHLVLQGASGDTMIGEVPTPTSTFIGNSPWMANIQAARQAVDDKFVGSLSPANFVPAGKYMVPRASFKVPPPAMPEFMAKLPMSFVTPAPGKESTIPAFKTAVPATKARLTGVGFFDKVHGQTGVSQFNGIELHPVLKIEFL